MTWAAWRLMSASRAPTALFAPWRWLSLVVVVEGPLKIYLFIAAALSRTSEMKQTTTKELLITKRPQRRFTRLPTPSPVGFNSGSEKSQRSNQMKKGSLWSTLDDEIPLEMEPIQRRKGSSPITWNNLFISLPSTKKSLMQSKLIYLVSREEREQKRLNEMLSCFNLY